MIPCVQGGPNYQPHLTEVVAMAEELTISAIEKGESGLIPVVPFLGDTYNICPHVSRVILLYIASNATGARGYRKAVTGYSAFILANLNAHFRL